MDIFWGMLGPERIISTSRARTLGLGSVVRHYNDRAVPGLGGIWFGKQLLLALMGIAVAQRLRDCSDNAKNIETANAIEALACLLSFERNGHSSDSRLRGVEKLRGKKDRAFSTLRRPGFYVAQPMRTATVQPLPALGLVEGGMVMFNDYRCSQLGKDFIDAACGVVPLRYGTQSVLDVLSSWASAGDRPPNAKDSLVTVLSPLEPLAGEACGHLRQQLRNGAGEGPRRRRDALAWVESLARPGARHEGWERKPECLSIEHWMDLRSGAAFFQARDAALDLLDATEAQLRNKVDERALRLDGPFPNELEQPVSSLRRLAKAFLDLGSDTSPGKMASSFCLECSQDSPSRVLRNLAERDGRCLRLVDGALLPGVAFRKSQGIPDPGAQTERQQPDADKQDTFPHGISARMRNLYLLNLDLHGRIEEALSQAPTEDSDVQ
ncbi:hypothetical protein [Fundidesulfovibrio soli]|uniref:hypothetical protein n=1 Tax=Fundidesulfovibrio soli TaxID=2922716 RepID=UPI001FB03061|nr:hypothetical protein [Fundidesulfovibrio soli]